MATSYTQMFVQIVFAVGDRKSRIASTNETLVYDHISEIIGLKVYQAEKLIGTVFDIKDYPQGDYLDILLETKKHAYIPFRDEFVTDVDIEKEYVKIIEMEGLI